MTVVLNSSTDRVPVDVDVGYGHEDGDLQALSFEDLWFVALLDGHDSSVARGYYSPVYVDVFPVRFAEEVDNQNERNQSHNCRRGVEWLWHG